MANLIKRRFNHWMALHNPPTHEAIKLHHRRLYILPTRFGYIYTFLLFVIFLAAINYSNSMAFALSFLLTAIGIISLWLTHKNLLNLNIELFQPTAVFCGEDIELKFLLTNNDQFDHYAIGIQYQQQSPCYNSIEPNSSCELTLKLKTETRGSFDLDGFTLFTRFPTGLFHCWGWLRFTQKVIVYPKPIDTKLVAMTFVPHADGNSSIKSSDGDDFEGLREYRKGESLKHISWKAFAQGKGKLSKIYSAQSQPSLWIDWSKITAKSIEEKISRLTSLIIKADNDLQKYGLITPFTKIEQNTGSSHKELCLSTLSTYKQSKNQIFMTEDN